MKAIFTGLVVVVLATLLAPFFLLYNIGAGVRTNPATMIPCSIGHGLLWVLVARMVGWL
jgi:hypothetical protein